MAGCHAVEHGFGRTWGDEATYHALAVASQYQGQLIVVLAKISAPGLTSEQIDAMARPLSQSLGELAGVASVRTQPRDGGLMIEVHYRHPAGSDQLDEVKRKLDSHWQEGPTKSGTSTVTLAPASL
jgi:multidrug efflux pump subunit AcrB